MDKNQKKIKPRDPNFQQMIDLRKSGAMGAHRDKKKELKQGKVKHKGNTMNIESNYENPAGKELSRLGRILMDKAITQKDDNLSNIMSRVGDELTRYGEFGGARTLDELVKRTKVSKEGIEKLMTYASKQKDTSLDKVKDPDPSPDDEDEKESYTAENTPIGHVDDERHMIRKELYQMATYAKELFQMLEGLPADSDFPHWWQAKVTKSLQMLSKAKHYLENELAVPEEGVEEADILDKLKKDIKQGWGATKAQFKDPFNMNAASDYLDKAEKDNMGFTDKEIKMAFGVLNDPRYKGGNYSGAVKTIEKIAPGLSDHPSVKKALQRTNESLCHECGKPRFVALPEELQQKYESVNEEKQKGVDGKVCWKGYKRMGTKKKNGKTVDNCVKM